MIKNSDGSEFAESRIAGMDVQIDLLAPLQRQANTCSCRLGEANCFAHHCECRGCWTESRGVGDLLLRLNCASGRTARRTHFCPIHSVERSLLGRVEFIDVDEKYSCSLG